MKQKTVLTIFAVLVFLTLLVPVVFSEELLYPFVTVRALLLRALLLLALPAYLYLIASNFKLRPSWKNPLHISVAAFFLANVVSIFAGANPGRSWWGNYERMGGTYHLLHLTLLYFYIVLLGRAEGKWLRKFLDWLIAIGAVTSLYGLFTALGMPRWFLDPSFPRVSVTFGNPIFFASFLVLPLFLSLFFAVEEDGTKRARRNFYITAALLCAVGVFVSGTRGAVAGVGIGLLLMAFLYAIKSGKRLKTASIAVIIAAVAGFGLLYVVRGKLPPSSTLRRLVTLKDSNTEARLIQWKTAWRGFLDKPVFGYGPENYQIVANKYYDRNLYKYDSSWFDKPHNYPLEILVTTGIIGFLGYLSLVVFSFWAVYRAFREELISWQGFAALVSGIAAYQIQNLFVFDTIAAALAFFAITGFFGYLYEESSAKEEKTRVRVPLWAPVLAGLAALGSLYAVAVTDIATALVLKDINYGYAIDIKDPKKAKTYFDKASGQLFVYDRGELGTKYEEFAIRVAQDLPDKSDTVFINSALDAAIGALKPVAEKTGNNPIYWYKLGNLYSVKAYFNKTGYDPRAEEFIQKAIALVPGRIEPYYFMIQISALKNDIPGAVSIAERISAMVPENAEAKWRLALAYKDAKRDEDAGKMGEEAVRMGYQFKLVQEFRWFINYYVDRQEYPKVVGLYEIAVKLSPEDSQLWANLAAAYAKVGDKQKAVAAAEKVKQLNPASASQVDSFIKSIQ